MSQDPGVLFTAFEPSGDEHAAGLVAALRKARPGLPVWAIGGPKMAAAGAELIESTGGHGVMLLGAVSQIKAHRDRLKRLDRWLSGHPLAALIPVDSPAANWSICKLVRKRMPRARIVHLVAPQLWAWAPWRIGKLRRLTDHVLCLLPFEEEWFGSRGVKATFVGHPLFEERQRAADDAGELPQGRPRLALLPGSRRSEIQKNWPVMAGAAQELRRRAPGLELAVAVRDQTAADLVEAMRFSAPETRRLESLCVCIGQIDRVLEWSDAALVVSGTATLRVASHLKPMAAVYRANRLAWNLLGRFIIRTRTFTLPNLISESLGRGRAVPEFVPYFGDARNPRNPRNPRELVDALEPLLTDRGARQRQEDALRAVIAPFAGHDFAREACAVVVSELDRQA